MLLFSEAVGKKVEFPRETKIGEKVTHLSFSLTPSQMVRLRFTPLEIIRYCSAVGLHSNTIPAGFNAPLEFLTGSTWPRQPF